LHPNTVGDWKAGRNMPSMENMQKMADIFGEDVETIIRIFRGPVAGGNDELFVHQGQWLRSVRESSGLPLERFAQSIGFTTTNVNNAMSRDRLSNLVLYNVAKVNAWDVKYLETELGALPPNVHFYFFQLSNHPLCWDANPSFLQIQLSPHALL